MFICMQTINFISHLFFEILQRNCKDAILATLGMLDHTHQKLYFQFAGNFYAYLHAKNQLMNHFFLKIFKRNSKLVVLGNLRMSGHTQNDSINSKKPLMFICRQKINFICHSFLGILQICYFGYFEYA